jgi:CRP/FNR family cyclic AMP-dependent transcriptional regulator
MVHQSQDSMANVDPGVTAFLRAADASSDREPLVVLRWQQADWESLFSHARHVKVAGGNMLIRQDAAERALYFVESGVLEVTSVGSYLRVSSIGWFHPGSVVGELSFLDGKPRSAEIWAVVDSELYRLDFQDYQAFADAHPRKACDLVLAIGRVVALRLRHTLSNIERSVD